ncbi:replicative DNA helicase [Oceanococcus atlanticus]|uniref:Replicative DNA helicase n=1 Tax=Oceanococcus atlanticus TaxID=1317117 RepID=A0A1Y1SGR5_9GAMM|nr:replicative DNA helicase [Oceanococcus atlanticus]ORE88855.1 replicative DNA helicase [Oceanococcus atlanticus]RZO82513.1 MAG: replicative DNA helicase [Oceanococcus sp.]
MDKDFESSTKVPPHSLLAEQSVIGGLMHDSNVWDDLADRLIPEDFYRHEHRLIYEALSELAKRYQPLDAVTVSEHLEANGKIDDTGGLPYLAGLVQDTPGASNILAWADIVREHSIRRQLIRAGAVIIEQGYAKDGTDTGDLLDQAEREVFQIAERRRHNDKVGVQVADLVGAAVEEIQRRSEGLETAGLPTGLNRFDDRTTGLHAGDLVILAARPAMGKTSLAMNWVEHAAMIKKVPAAVFSMEMPALQLAQRLISSHGRINQESLRKGQLSPEEWGRINSAATTLRESVIIIDDTPALSPTELRARARRMKREHDIGLIMVDYLQLMQVPNSRENRTNEIAEISRSMKALAKELELPIIALSQLNRSVEQRDNKRPRMSDLRESGGIEQDADLIVFIYRDEYYNPDSIDKGVAEVIIAKQRNGPTGTVRAAFIGQYTRFENLATEYMDDDME